VHCNATYSVIKISSEAEKLLQSDHQSQLPQFLLWASIMNFFFDGTRYFTGLTENAGPENGGPK